MDYHAALRVAQDHFAELLPHVPPAVEYLAARRGAAELTPVAGLGYAHPGYTAVLTGRGVPMDRLVETGLLNKRLEEVFAHRITFPWTSMDGQRVLGMGGRSWIPGDGRAKYENSPQPGFYKGRTLFGIHQASAAMHRAGWTLVVEGPFDVIACWHHGWTNAVAPVGAKLTLDHLLQIARLVDTFVLLLDDDEGGRRGAETVRHLLAQDVVPPLEVHHATLVGANDPGEATREQIQAAIVGGLPLVHN